MFRWCVLIFLAVASAKLEEEINENDIIGDKNNDTAEYDDGEVEDSSETIGASVVPITRHPYAASLLRNNQYICSATILNNYWLLTDTKCFDKHTLLAVATLKTLANYTIRVGSSFNNKGGSILQLQSIQKNYDLKTTLIKLVHAVEFNAHVQPIRLPDDERVDLGYLASILAWTPSGHLRTVNSPVVEAGICDNYSKLMPGFYVCLAGVQDLNRDFCRRDNGGAIIQNNTLIGISSFSHNCALYTRAHAFPKVSRFSQWIDSIIWDEERAPERIRVTHLQETSTSASMTTQNVSSYYEDPRRFILTLPFDPIDVPLEPSGDNSVIPRMSFYEAYLQKIAKAKATTTQKPKHPKKAAASNYQAHQRNMIRLPSKNGFLYR